MTHFTKIMIVGCGNVGSYLANVISLRSRSENDIEELILVDNDLLHEPNFPYLVMNLAEAKSMSFLRNPKVICLKYLLSKIKSKDLNIIYCVCKYPEEKYLLERYLNDCLIIDCRDTDNDLSEFKIKLSQDGKFGNVIINPQNVEINKKNNYVLKSDKYICSLFVSDFCKMLFEDRGDLLNDDNKQYLLDYRRGGKLLLLDR